MNDASSMAANLAALIPDAVVFMNAIVSLLAVGLFIAAVNKLVSHAKGRDGTRLSTPVMLLLSGTMLWNLGMAATSLLETTFGDGTSTSTLMTYAGSDSMPSETQAFLKVLIMAIRLYGYYAFAAGWWKVRNIGAGTHASESAFGSAFWHIVGGICAINIVQSVNVITSTLGFGDVL